ncbi:MAG: M48 family metalloprotease [Candidatus Omnitrophica bacterium]|nr:M48 family metalloprotease [Candidatus Omnitrophota bacterium]
MYKTASSSSEYYHWQWFSFKEMLWAFMAAALVVLWQWLVATSELMNRFIGILNAEPANKNDAYHHVFMNIVEEVSVATGGKKMEPFVVPTMAMNAFAISDFRGRSIIGVTEGLLARLNRQQIEAVVGHEAAHIASGDSAQTTVISSLFEGYNAAIAGVEGMFGRTRSSSSRNSFMGLVIIIYIVLIISRFMATLLKMFIAREREYRADAIAVRLTRDPLSLAEALYAITYHWKLQGMPSAELDSIFTVSPNLTPDKEGNSLTDELFQTHPPVLDRIKILLDMAHTDLKNLVEDVDAKIDHARIEAPELTNHTAPTGTWMVNHDNQWEGPYGLQQISGLVWFRPDMWVKRMGEETVKFAYDDQDLITMFKQQHATAEGAMCCPKCHVGLGDLEYEGVLVRRCLACGGTLVGETDVQRIIIRPEVGFSDRIKKIGDQIDKNYEVWAGQKIDRSPANLFTCPKCANDRCKMNRMFYTAAYQVEIDKCFYCGLVWFDKDELEILQYIVEKRSLSSYDNKY